MTFRRIRKDGNSPTGVGGASVTEDRKRGIADDSEVAEKSREIPLFADSFGNDGL